MNPKAWLPASIFAGSAIPGLLLLFRFATDDLGANPVSELLNGLGELGVKLLILSLACTPAVRFFEMPWAILARRPLGLAAFSYGVLHLATYFVFDRQGSLPGLVADVIERPFIAFGMATLLLLVPLAVTSTDRARKRLGSKRWRRLHMLVYPASLLAIVHYVMKQKADVVVPLVHGGVLVLLLALRFVPHPSRPRRSAPK